MISARLVRLTCAAAFMATAVLTSPTSATTLFPEQFTCPIGGESFEDYVVGSYSSWGQRPDGRPYGTLPVMPLIECPGNGFPIYQEDFTPAAIERLTPLVESDAFQILRTSETPHYRLWWLMNEMGEAPFALANALLVASWETDDDPARKARYQTHFVEVVATIPTAHLEEWFYYNLRAANALRELARFDEAARLLGRVEASPYLPDDDDEREGLRNLFAGLSRLISEANAHPEPTNLIPPLQAAQRCSGERMGLTPSEVEACTSPDHLEAIAEWLDFDVDMEDTGFAADCAEEGGEAVCSSNDLFEGGE